MFWLSSSGFSGYARGKYSLAFPTGVGFIGLLFLVIGIIITLRFPNIVTDWTKVEFCIVKETNKGYKNWVYDLDRDVTILMEIRNLTDLESTLPQISHIVRIDNNPAFVARAAVAPQPTYLNIQLADNGQDPLEPHIDPFIEFVHNARRHGGMVLVHCMLGASRSVVLTATYMMAICNYAYKDVLKVIKHGREAACPNGFLVRELGGVEKQKKRIQQHAGLIGNDIAEIKQVLEAIGTAATSPR